MNCRNCYQEIPDNSKFCPHCGAKQTETTMTAADNAAETVEASSVNPQESVVENRSQKEESEVGNYASPEYNNQYQTPPVYTEEAQAEPVNWIPYLVLAIISTVCCCLPFGIVSIVYAAKINSATSAGNNEEAQKAAKTARIWLIVSFVCGILVTVIYALVYTALIGAGYYYY